MACHGAWAKALTMGFGRSPVLGHFRTLECSLCTATRAPSCSASPSQDTQHSTAALRVAAWWSGGIATAIASSFALGGLSACEEDKRASAGQTQKAASQLQEFSKEEVSEHSSRDKRVWVTYKDGVYDVTDFLDMHPGGSHRLMLAAGGAIDPFWAMYAQHNTAEVKGMLEGYRIGKLVSGFSSE